MLKDGTFAGKVALVTGGGTGLGLEISRGLLRLGASAVVVASRDPGHHQTIANEAREFGGVVDTISLDVREYDRVHEAFRAAADRHGGLDIVVNNAAGNFVVPSLRLRAKGWRAVIDIALSGTFFGCQAAGRIMEKAGTGGAIVNIAATYAWTGMPGVVHSAAAKAGVVAVTRTLGAEWAPYGIRVNAVAPGPFESSGAEANLWPTEEARKAVLDSIPAGRFATAREVADSVLYLASPMAGYVTGECLVVDGGHWLGKGLHAGA